ncbi:TSCPD domain-containing protein [Ostreibacterium oceani]|uniref:ribonucleoside-diphosphate reductase n=1 Tax=Ostreibacterium oceani TaxID=2654998 RepID=A0A6N7EXW5_9GAMM|nr:NrdJb [Ostreibacterium oceani]MPV86229.1 NrdJb [Ostreibacterium oceani]
MIKIDKKITGYAIKKADEPADASADVLAGVSADTKATTIGKQGEAGGQPAASGPIEMHESINRPEKLFGSTYKVKTPLSEHALYVTINDYLLNEGTEYEQRRPYEMFINSKNMEHFQWIVALTRVISAVFRKGGDSTFLVEELKSVFDPQGGYFKSGGRYMPSIIAELGDVIESHMKSIGMIRDEQDQHQQRLIFEKQQQLAAKEKEKQQQGMAASATETANTSGYPASAVLCKKCFAKAVVVMDGCATCLSCGDSKCG